jgi:mitochondrial distribution and morphology protein 34
MQANPMSTYVGSTQSFTSPQPLAAADGLTIPLSITLSHFKLSAFIIVVYSKHKGVTIVFRNDPLESLKVSSTFDSILFVRDYLQTTIENKLRTLIMDELPTIIHRMSLKVLCHRLIRDDGDDGEGEINPLASPPSDPVDSNGNVLDEADVSTLSLDETGEPIFQFESLFSHLNLLRLKNVAAAHDVLSTFTPSLRDMHFRAVDSDSTDSSGSSTPLTPGAILSRSNTYSFSETASNAQGPLSSRPSLVSLGSATTGLALGAGRSRSSYMTRKRKHRVVNLRRSKSEVGSSASSEAGDSTVDVASIPDIMSEPVINSSIPELPEEDPPIIDAVRVHIEQESTSARTAQAAPEPSPQPEPAKATVTITYPSEKSEKAHRPVASASSIAMSDAPSVILEQAWISKMASEIARRVYDEKNRRDGFWDEREDVPPPAYEAAG